MYAKKKLYRKKNYLSLKKYGHMAEKNKVNENKLDYEPWGFNSTVGYTHRSCVQTVEKFFVNAKYSKKDEKIHFFNVKGEETCSINVKEFSSDSIKGISYDYVTKILVITYESGKELEINLTDFINSIVSKIEQDVESLSGTVEEIVNQEAQMLSIMFSDAEYEWDEENKKMVINFYNANNELKDSVELFDTNDVGEIMIEAGNF